MVGAIKEARSRPRRWRKKPPQRNLVTTGAFREPEASIMPLKVDIVTAERLVFSEEGWTRSSPPGIEGELTVLPMHAPLLTMIKPGIMRLVKGGEDIDMAITGGSSKSATTA